MNHHPLLIALDVDTTARALELAADLHGVVGGFKVGKQLFVSEGPPIVRALTERDERVFLDLKFHDIPNTVAGAVRSATRLGAWMVNVHASGGSEMLRAAVAAAGEEAARVNRPRPLVIAVTVLTSIDQATLQSVGVTRPLIDQVEALALLAHEAGLDGVVASAQEAPRIRAACGPEFLIVTPGIRPAAEKTAGAKTDDQARTLTAAEAIAAGATHLVVGRPVLKAGNPRQAAQQLSDEILAARA
jgi:orotidine-5'-phosphate decarboxylase